jgi:hypothetical protein
LCVISRDKKGKTQDNQDKETNRIKYRIQKNTTNPGETEIFRNVQTCHGTHSVQTGHGTHSASFHGYFLSFLGLKRPGLDADHPPQSNPALRLKKK